MFCEPDVRKPIRAIHFLVNYILRFWNRNFFSKSLFQFKFEALSPACLSNSNWKLYFKNQCFISRNEVSFLGWKRRFKLQNYRNSSFLQTFLALQDVFSVLIFHLPRRFQDVLCKTFSKEVLKTSCLRFVRRINITLKASSTRLQHAFIKTNVSWVSIMLFRFQFQVWLPELMLHFRNGSFFPTC